MAKVVITIDDDTGLMDGQGSCEIEGVEFLDGSDGEDITEEQWNQLSAAQQLGMMAMNYLQDVIADRLRQHEASN